MRSVALVSIGLSAIAYAQVNDAVDMTRKSIQIQPEALRAALPTFGEVEGLRMVFLPDDVGNQNTSGVSGSLTHAEALEQLLRGTDLTYRFLEAHTVAILPARLAGVVAVEPSSASGSEGKTGQASGAPVGPGTRMAQVTVTATAPSDMQQLEYFRLLAAMSRSDYKHQAKTLPFVDVGTVRFPGGKGPEHRLPLGQHIQSAGIDGIVLWRVIKLTPTKAISELQAHNSNPFPVFVEIDFEATRLGRGPYAALAPGETAVWTWTPSGCGRAGSKFTAAPLSGTSWLTDWDCGSYVIQPGVAHVRVLKEWNPEVEAPARPPGSQGDALSAVPGPIAR
jgi:hypothetical protein